MPLCDDLDDDEPQKLDHWRFDDCAGCVSRFKPRTCAGCGNGEYFEEEEPEGIDSLFR